MVAQGSGAAGPVLLACRQWDPHAAGADAAEPRGRCVALCSTTALAAAVRCLSGRGAHGRLGKTGPVPVLGSPPLLPPFLAPLTVRVAGCPVRVLLVLACWYAIPCGLFVPRARSGCPFGAGRAPVVCVCAPASAVCTLSPLADVAHALRAVPVQGAGRAVPGGSSHSAFPALVLCSSCLVCGGVDPVRAHPCLSSGSAPLRGVFVISGWPRWCFWVVRSWALSLL